MSPTVLKGDFLRDLGVYILAIGAIIVVAMDGKVYVYESAMFLVIYLIYVATATCLSSWKKLQ